MRTHGKRKRRLHRDGRGRAKPSLVLTGLLRWRIFRCLLRCCWLFLLGKLRCCSRSLILECSAGELIGQDFECLGYKLGVGCIVDSRTSTRTKEGWVGIFYRGKSCPCASSRSDPIVTIRVARHTRLRLVRLFQLVRPVPRLLPRRFCNRQSCRLCGTRVFLLPRCL